VNSAHKALQIPSPGAIDERLTWLSSVDFGAAPTSPNAQSALDAIVNHQIQQLAMMLKTQLGKPLGHHQGGTARPEMVESVYSKRGLMDIIDNLSGIRAALHGTWEAAEKGHAVHGIAGYLHSLQSPAGARALAAVDQAITLAQALNEQGNLAALIQLQPENVQKLFDAVTQISIIYTTEIAGVLGVTVRFGDSDGD
jgi:predicted lipoprotein